MNELSDSSRVATVSVPGGLRLPDGQPLERFISATTISADSTTVYGDEFVASPGLTELFALDLHTLRVRWHQPMSDIAACSVIGPVGLGEGALVVNRDGTRLFLSGVTPDGPGLVVVDVATLAPVAAVPAVGLTGGSLALTPPRLGFPEGVLLAAGRRPNADSSTNTLFLIDPVALTVADSVPNLILPPNTADESVGQLVVAADGRDVYASTTARALAQATVIHVDLDARAVLARTRTTPFAGGMAVSPDGSTVFVADAGDARDTPGSGTIFRYDAALHPLPPIQLPTNLPPSHQLLVTNCLAVSADSRTLYATSGDADLGPSFGFEPARLLIIDLATSRVQAVSLGDSDPGAVYLHGGAAAP